MISLPLMLQGKDDKGKGKGKGKGKDTAQAGSRKIRKGPHFGILI